jgi:hypothetical protein
MTHYPEFKPVPSTILAHLLNGVRKRLNILAVYDWNRSGSVYRYRCQDPETGFHYLINAIEQRESTT